jgi:ABC-type enterobactin transport system permease subunit
MNTMNALNWLYVVVLAGLCGAFGQSARVVVGLKKVYDASAAAQKNFSEFFDWSRLLLSLLIGAAAGLLGAISLQPDFLHLTSKDLMAFAAAGYAGTDFIEAFMSRNEPKKNGGAG